jgi:hypothetical protein
MLVQERQVDPQGAPQKSQRLADRIAGLEGASAAVEVGNQRGQSPLGGRSLDGVQRG